MQASRRFRSIACAFLFCASLFARGKQGVDANLGKWTLQITSSEAESCDQVMLKRMDARFQFRICQLLQANLAQLSAQERSIEIQFDACEKPGRIVASCAVIQGVSSKDPDFKREDERVELSMNTNLVAWIKARIEKALELKLIESGRTRALRVAEFRNANGSTPKGHEWASSNSITLGAIPGGFTLGLAEKSEIPTILTDYRAFLRMTHEK
jgi:hypothetical protein